MNIVKKCLKKNKMATLIVYQNEAQIQEVGCQKLFSLTPSCLLVLAAHCMICPE